MAQPMFRGAGLGSAGEGWHRSGWPYVMQALQPWFAEDAPVLLDDYVERTFLLKPHRNKGLVHRSPWIGVFHHPLKDPFGQGTGQKALRNSPAWQESLPQLKLAVVLAEHLAPGMGKLWGVPCLVLRHPTEVPALRWSPEAFQRNPSKKLVQIGAYLRNTHAIFQAGAPPWLEKVRLSQGAAWVQQLHAHCRGLFPGRRDVGAVTEMTRLPPDAYDRLLAENLVFLELLDVVANNTIVECIARDTPIVVNRLPGTEFYLGRDYPLFYQDIGEVEALLTPERILEAHHYLTQLPKDWLNGETFARALVEGCLQTVPELWS